MKKTEVEINFKTKVPEVEIKDPIIVFEPPSQSTIEN